MSAYELLVFVHVLLFVYWLGADIGVFISARSLVNEKLPVPGRAIAAKIFFTIDMAPRTSHVMMLPIGFSLAAALGISPITGIWLVLVWVVGVAWLGLTWYIRVKTGTVSGRTAERFDVWFRAVLVVVLIVTGAVSLITDTPFSQSWLTLKIGLFGIIVASGAGIRLTLKPFGPAFAQLMSDGPSPTVNDTLRSAMRRSYPFVFTIWTLGPAGLAGHREALVNPAAWSFTLPPCRASLKGRARRPRTRATPKQCQPVGVRSLDRAVNDPS